MNERIKEMYNQCFVELENDTPNIGFDFEKFAELIIKECAKVCYRTGVLEQDERTGWMYGDAIQEHFGIE